MSIMAHLYLVRHCYIAVAHHIHGAPLMSILAIAVFLVVPWLIPPPVERRRRLQDGISRIQKVAAVEIVFDK